jgi:hypothetical protein
MDERLRRELDGMVERRGSRVIEAEALQAPTRR